MTNSTTADTLIGTSGNDTFTGAAANYADTDQVIDISTTDHDTYNLTISAAAVPKVTNVENVNITTESTSAFNDVTAKDMSGITTLTVTGGNLTVGTSVITGNKDIIVLEASSANIAKIVAGAGTNDLTVNQTATTAGAVYSAAGMVVDASTVTGDITITGATTLNADLAADTAGEKVTVTAINGAAAAQNEKAITINAAKALDVEVTDNTSVFTGLITVNAAAAQELLIESAVGGAIVNAANAAETVVGAAGIDINGIDDSGVTITTGSYGSVVNGTITNAGSIILAGTASSDVATITAGGYITLDSVDATGGNNQIETLNLSGNAAAVTYTMTGAASTYTLTGSQSVTLAGNESSFDGKTITDTTTAGTTTLNITTLDTSDLSKAAVDLIKVSGTATSKVITVASGANVQLAADETTAFGIAGKTADATVNLSTGDDTSASGATIDITTTTLTLSTNVKTVNFDATIGKLTVTNTTLATTGTLNVTGSKDVALGNLTAKELAASSATGAISLDTANAGLLTIATGSGDDVVIVDQNVKYTSVNLGEGTNTLTIAAAVATDAGSFTTGSGTDTVNIDNTAANVVVTGAGDDTVNIGNVATDSIIVMGDGTGDKVVFTTANALDLSDNDNFVMTGVEIVDITAANNRIDISAAAFAYDNAFRIDGDSATADIFHVVNTGTTGATIDASSITFESTQAAALELEGKALLKDTITGSAKNDTIVATSGGDVVDGGSGTDTYLAANLAAATEGAGTDTSTGVVINLGATAVTNTSVLGAGVGYTADTVTSVAAGTIAYTFAASATTNSAVTATIANVENVTGTTGNDYIVGSAANNSITGGTGADYINVGAGTDTVVIAAAGDSQKTATSATTVTKVGLTGVDVIAGLAAGDKIDFTALGGGNNTTIVTTHTTADTKVNMYVGTWDNVAKTFTGGAGADTMLIVDEDGSGLGVNFDSIILVGFNGTASTVTAGGLLTLG